MLQQLHPELFLEFVLVSLLIVLTTMGIMLYRRYSRIVNLVFASSMGIATLFYVLVIFEWLYKPKTMALSLTTLSFASFCVVQMGFYHFFNQNRIKQLLVFIVPLIVTFSSALLLWRTDNVTLGIIILNVVFTLFIYGWTKSQLPKIKMFQWSYIINVVSAIAQAFFLLVPKHEQIIFALSLGLMLIHYFVMFIIFFDRIIDLLQAVSTSSVQDGLTGLYNKKFFKKKVAEAVESQVPCSLLFSDIDNFKILNDTLGHQMGDTMLKFVAQVMKEVCGEHGIVGRYGGEEMVALITNPRANTAELAEIFRYRVQEESQGITPVTCSIGYSFVSKGITGDGLIIQADEAMYLAKRGGKNRVVSFQQQPPNELQPDQGK